MSTQVSLNGLYEEALRYSDYIARNARILDNRLPEDSDFLDPEMKALQDQLNSLTIFPLEKRDWFYLAFSARHLPALVDALRTTSRETQREAFSAYIQLLSLLPEPQRNPYLRKFLCSERAAGLPNLLASAFIQSIEWLRPSGPGYICALIASCLQWCDTDMGDDKRASIDKALRQRLLAKLRIIMEQARYKTAIDEHNRLGIEVLHGLLSAVDEMEVPSDQPGFFLKSTRDYLAGSIPGQRECNVCMEEGAELRCARCKSVKYCGKECQKQDWRGEHRMRCFAMAF
ncbi:hypothetical protein HDZ31DRAFT_49917 [Schizophyllum fasciatum]